MNDYLVKASALSGFRATVIELGGDIDALFKQAGLSDHNLDPESWLSYRRYLNLLDCASKAIHCPHFGIKLSTHQDIAILGVLGFVMQQAPDLRSALRELVIYFSHHNQGASVTLNVENGIAQWKFICKLEGKVPTWQQGDLAAGLGVNVMKLLCGSDWKPNAVYLAHAPTEDIAVYKACFQCPVFFNWDATVIAFDGVTLDRPISDADQHLHRVLEEYLNIGQLAPPNDFCGQIRLLIKQGLSTGDCSIERVASSLAVNKRTLQRRLKANNCNYKELLDEVRFDLACRYLQESNGSLTALADMLCYSELSAFSNAFRNHFGVSPRAWKKQQAPIITL